MRAALSGVQTLFLASGYRPTRLEQHYRAIAEKADALTGHAPQTLADFVHQHPES
jgi:predicted lipoprotein